MQFYTRLQINSSTNQIVNKYRGTQTISTNTGYEWIAWNKTLPEIDEKEIDIFDGEYYLSDGSIYAESDFSGDPLTCYTQAELDALEETEE